MLDEKVEEKIRSVLKEHGRLGVEVDALSLDADLHASGLTSHATMSVVIALEQAFGSEFPDSLLTRGVFGSIASIGAALEQVGRVSAE